MRFLSSLVLVFVVSGCGRETGPPLNILPPPRTHELDSLSYEFIPTAEDEVVISVLGDYSGGEVLQDEVARAEFVPDAHRLAVSASLPIDTRNQTHSFQMNLHRTGSRDTYTFEVTGYRHRFANGFDETVVHDLENETILDYSMSPQRDRFFYVSHGASGSALWSLDLATWTVTQLDDDFPALHVRAIDANRLVVPQGVEGGEADLALLRVLDLQTFDYQTVTEVSFSYLRLSEVVDGLLFTNRPFFDKGPPSLLIDFDTGEIESIDADYKFLRPHRVDHIWLGNDILDAATRSLIPLDTAGVEYTTGRWVSADRSTVVASEWLPPVGPQRVVVYRDGVRVHAESDWLHKRVSVVQDSHEANTLLVAQFSPALDSPASQRVSPGLYELNLDTGKLALVHTSPQAREHYRLSDGDILALRHQKLVRLTP